MKEIVTVIIVCHNAKKTITAMIDSLFAQTRKPDIIVIADNESKDSTWSKLYNYFVQLGHASIKNIDKTPELVLKMSDTLLRAIRIPHANTAAARNMLIKEAFKPTTFFVFMEQDTFFEPNKIELSLETMKKNRAICCAVSDYDITNPKTKRVHRIYAHSFDIRQLLEKQLYDFSCIVHKGILQKTGLFNEKLPFCVEHDFFVRLAEQGLIYHIPQVLHHQIPHKIVPVDKVKVEYYMKKIREESYRRKVHGAQ